MQRRIAVPLPCRRVLMSTLVALSATLFIGCGDGKDPTSSAACALAAPAGVRTTSTTSGGSLVLFVLWDAVPTATSFVFEMGTAAGATNFTRDVTLNASGDGGGAIVIGVGTNAYTFVPGTSYYIRVRAKNTCTGPASVEIRRDYN